MLLCPRRDERSTFVQQLNIMPLVVHQQVISHDNVCISPVGIMAYISFSPLFFYVRGRHRLAPVIWNLFACPRSILKKNSPNRPTPRRRAQAPYLLHPPLPTLNVPAVGWLPGWWQGRLAALATFTRCWALHTRTLSRKTCW